MFYTTTIDSEKGSVVRLGVFPALTHNVYNEFLKLATSEYQSKHGITFSQDGFMLVLHYSSPVTLSAEIADGINAALTQASDNLERA